ncbi:DUF4340 domain-containing protein [Luteolibacter sp. SL250]|uniref:DUF4340 domain-containing protein n=1 Tax=Luteolibacter sp. SL250 TaxID=2995170 RepID=UPI00226E1061|nr:DUF4340 domain-containing protein [Luteolibacter sp. SL250]WAC21602.1 DUF4340 domain-containing protein [Luteolibacter sp. SL250]
MNKRQVIILWIVAAVLAASVALIKRGKENETKSATNRAAGQTLLESFPAGDVATIEIKGADSSVTLARKDGKWIVPQREDFPAKSNGVNSVNDLLRTVADLKIAQSMQAGPSFAARFGMDESSKDPKEHGINVIFKDSAGKELANLTVGKNIESAAGSGVPLAGGGSTGRFVRNHADDSGFYATSELFPSLSDQPKSWLAADEFLRIEKIQSISVTLPGKDEIAWKAVRNSEDAEFSLDGAADNEAIEPATANSLKSLLAYNRFDDVVPKADIEKRAVADQKRVAVIKTFEGITYTITFTPSKPDEKPASSNPEDPSPAAQDTFLVSVVVEADIPKERKKEEGEKPEDAKTKDEAFATRTKELNESLARVKSFAPYTFQVAKASFEQLLKDRATLTKPPEPQGQGAQAPQAGPQGGGFNLPPGMIVPGMGPSNQAVSEPVEAVTPPVSIPAADEKPAEEKAPEEKPAEAPEKK